MFLFYIDTSCKYKLIDNLLRKLKSKIKSIFINFKMAKTQIENDFELVQHGGLFDEYLEMG
jgi:hypothetical protein